MANGFLPTNAGIGAIPPELFAQQQALNRQQQMAQLLMQQGMNQPQGQMVSGRYVAPSFFQYATPLAQMYAGTRLQEKGDKATLDLAAKLRETQNKEIEQFGELMKTDPAAAYRFAAQSYSPELRTTGVKKMMPEDITLGEGQKRFTVMPDGTTRVVAQGEEKYRAPLQSDTGTFIEYRDPKNPNVVLARVPKTQMPTAGQVVEREDGTFLVDTRTGQAKPVLGPQGQPLTGGKPLTEVQSNAVAFGMRAIEANKLATDLENKGFTNTGAVRTAVAGTMGQTPIVGGRLEQGVRSAFNVLPEVLGGPSAEQQQNDQARRNFISAVLRKESGAAIGVEEYANEERKYFPQLGDSKEVIKQKQDARNLAIKALEAQAGPSGKRLIEKNASPQLSPQDQEALNWANSNPTDPRSAQIKQRLGR
jgi:hypothetical protein